MITRRPPCSAPCGPSPLPDTQIPSRPIRLQQLLYLLLPRALLIQPPGPPGACALPGPGGTGFATRMALARRGGFMAQELNRWEGTPQPWTCGDSALLSRHRGQAGAPRLRSLPCPAWVCSSSHSPVKPFPWHCGTRPSELKKDSAAVVIKIKVALMTRALFSSDILI